MAHVPMYVRIDERTKKRIEKIAKADRRSLAVMVEIALDEWMRDRASA